MVYELRPATSDHQTLTEMLAQRLEAVEKRSGVYGHLQSEISVDLSRPIIESLYHIAQEALNNSLKHASANTVTITLRDTKGWVELEVTDNGQGFNPNVLKNGGGFGLTSMREQAERLGGSLTITSAPNQGTRIKVAIPLTPEEGEEGQCLT